MPRSLASSVSLMLAGRTNSMLKPPLLPSRRLGTAPIGHCVKLRLMYFVAMLQLSIDVGTAKSIRDLGGNEEDIPILVGQALTDLTMLTTPAMPSSEDVRM